ncbi:GntR family transcriptional regulator [Nocardioides silvaticus]|uniref:GntR family transcriptional regulator n=1 Tax=Nocardioides silvaticus TaxID=2201891 RepID=A0A316TBN4_9ACTN|nr:GntR family transcriptional regulator [Nocardioides silvaticus]PWN01138.1 GntR family transcriptional regulator [Nocardioides silvaticus]
MPIPDRRVPIDRRLLREEVFGQLRDAIVDGTLAPGEQLKDLELADWLGVSRTPVREALLRLAEAGLVVATPGRSTVVSSVDLRAVREARDVVAALHSLALREAIDRLTRADLQRMREANRRFKQALRDGDVESALRADDDLHGVPVVVAGNTALTSVLEQFTPVLRRAERLRFSTLDGRASVRRHDDLIRLCEAGDVDEAAAVAFDTWHSLPATDAGDTDDATTTED